MVTDTKYDHEITLFTRKWPLHPPKGRTFCYTIYFRVHHGGISAKLLVYNLQLVFSSSMDNYSHVMACTLFHFIKFAFLTVF